MLNQDQVRLALYKRDAVYKFALDLLANLKIQTTVQYDLAGLNLEQQMFVLVAINNDQNKPRGLISVSLNDDRRFLRILLEPKAAN